MDLSPPGEGEEEPCGAGISCKAPAEPAESWAIGAGTIGFRPEDGLHGNLAKRAFRVELIKPSHYDRDGYVIQWLRSTLPSNSLASVYGLMREWADNRVIGPAVDI